MQNHIPSVAGHRIAAVRATPLAAGLVASGLSLVFLPLWALMVWLI